MGASIETATTSVISILVIMVFQLLVSHTPAAARVMISARAQPFERTRARYASSRVSKVRTLPEALRSTTPLGSLTTKRFSVDVALMLLTCFMPEKPGASFGAPGWGGGWGI